MAPSAAPRPGASKRLGGSFERSSTRPRAGRAAAAVPPVRAAKLAACSGARYRSRYSPPSSTFARTRSAIVGTNRPQPFNPRVTVPLEAAEGWWDAGALAPGDYRVRVIARDFAGNAATREIAVRVTH